MDLDIQQNDILLTGRSYLRKNEIKHLLLINHYNFSRMIFRPTKKFFSSGYVKWKLEEIQKLNEEFNSNIFVIDDNQDIIDGCIELGIECMLFDIREIKQ